jgi:hypothetical protein
MVAAGLLAAALLMADQATAQTTPTGSKVVTDCLAAAAQKWDDHTSDAATIAKMAGIECHQIFQRMVDEGMDQAGVATDPMRRNEVHEEFETVLSAWALKAVLTERQKHR